MNNHNFDTLRKALSKPDSLITSFDKHSKYLQDATEEIGYPVAIVIANNEQDVVNTVRFACEHNLAIVPRGAGTGLSGGCVPTDNSIVLSVENLRKLSIDPDAQRAVCGPGVITAELLDAAAKFDLTYPPDPASYLECSLGGNVAENAGGLRCKRFGVTRDYVLGMRAVTISGELIQTGCYNNYRGFALSDILIGSEGTLAIVVEMTLRLVPSPDRGQTMLVAFDRETDAGDTVAQITAAGIIPTVLEYLDRDAAACSNHYEKTDDGLDDVAAILLIEAQSFQTESITSICRANNCSYFQIESDPDRVENLWLVRRNLSKAIRSAAQYRYNEDVAVPVSQFMALIGFVADMNANSKLRVNAFGHAGDGNLHVSFLSMTGEPDEIALIESSRKELYKKTIALGGTLTGEHGIGSHKGEFLPWEFDQPTLKAMLAIKDVFDPISTMNPGKIFFLKKS